MSDLRRSMLFVPGFRPGMLQNSTIYGADSIIFDLEDSVAVSEKDAARVLVRNVLQELDFSGTEMVVRINPIIDSPFGKEDVAEIAGVRPDAFMLPKADEEGIRILAGMLDEIEQKEGFEQESIKIFALVESTSAVLNLSSIVKASTRLAGIMLGAEDLTAELGIKRTLQGNELLYARSHLAMVCKSAGIDAIDTPFGDVGDQEGLEYDATQARSLGLTGKAAIHPRQVGTINRTFSPSPEEVIYAGKVVAAVKEAEKAGNGVFALDGKMVDAPVAARAEKVLRQAKLAGIEV